MTPCKKCGEDIEFIRLKSGKFHPVNADSLAMHALVDGVLVITPGGDVMRGNALTTTARVHGYTSHFATCPFAAAFRRRTP